VSADRDTWQYVVDGSTVALPLVAILVTIAAYLLTYLRRPRVSIEEDADRVQSHLEGTDNLWPHVRLLASNKGWRRAAHETQVLVLGYRRSGEARSRMTSLGSPTLGWPSAGATNNAVTLHPGMSRPIDFGSLWPAKPRNAAGKYETGPVRTDRGPTGVTDEPLLTMVENGGEWQLRLGVPLSIADHREYLSPGEWIVTLAIGAHDGASATYDVHVAWNGDEPDPQKALDYLLDHLEVAAPSRA
jgi:hypothetical protein